MNVTTNPHPSAADAASKARAKSGSKSRSLWLKTLHELHWISSAVCLLGIVMFSVTGITLNHSTQIDTEPKTTHRQATAPAALQTEMREFAAQHKDAKLPLTEPVKKWVAEALSVHVDDEIAEWSASEVYLALPRPGGDAWLRIGLADGAAEYELTDRGWISWLNDLHKGRHTGRVWYWFIDVLAVACLFFSITGLLIMKFHAANRPSTWPIVGLGILIPVLIALLFIH